jgi:hypothetical protein
MCPLNENVQITSVHGSYSMKSVKNDIDEGRRSDELLSKPWVLGYVKFPCSDL